MSAPPESTGDSRGDNWTRIERIVERFEDAWQQGQRPNRDDFLRGGEDLMPGLLVELLRAEMEFRLKAGEAVHVEEYLTRYPELAADRPTVLALLAAEYQLRGLMGAALPVEDYRRRFPDFAAELASLPTVWDRERRRDASSAPILPAELPCVPGYEILEELGRGGMGIVYRARPRRSATKLSCSLPWREGARSAVAGRQARRKQRLPSPHRSSPAKTISATRQP